MSESLRVIAWPGTASAAGSRARVSSDVSAVLIPGPSKVKVRVVPWKVPSAISSPPERRMAEVMSCAVAVDSWVKVIPVTILGVVVRSAKERVRYSEVWPRVRDSMSFPSTSTTKAPSPDITGERSWLPRLSRIWKRMRGWTPVGMLSSSVQSWVSSLLPRTSASTLNMAAHAFQSFCPLVSVVR